MNRRALLASLGSTAALALAGCASTGSPANATDSRTAANRTVPESSAESSNDSADAEPVGAGDVVSGERDDVELGSLSLQSSFHHQVSLAWDIVGRCEELVVVLDVGVLKYGEDVRRLPVGVEVGCETNPAGDEFFVRAPNRPDAQVGLPVPAGSSADVAVVFAGADTAYRYALPDSLRKRIEHPPAWNVDVSFPETVRSDGEFDVAVIAENAGSSEGTLVGAVTHDRIYDGFWKFAVDVAAGETVTEPVTVDYVGGDAGGLGVSASWGLGTANGTVTVVTD
ncbi:hypothetical protein [Haladaptatus salinisoli]|uniref:hypothetical protein n=1 Tax=Haladaptatus salinisoli TaxID=2884876 RepID=UPI001D0B0290|nr:hypothetical protein [Haladaptatus salinisoli]